MLQQQNSCMSCFFCYITLITEKTLLTIMRKGHNACKNRCGSAICMLIAVNFLDNSQEWSIYLKRTLWDSIHCSHEGMIKIFQSFIHKIMLFWNLLYFALYSTVSKLTNSNDNCIISFWISRKLPHSPLAEWITKHCSSLLTGWQDEDFDSNIFCDVSNSSTVSGLL